MFLTVVKVENSLHHGKMDVKKDSEGCLTLRDIFVNNLKYFRTLKNFSQEALSAALNKSSTYINGVENKGTFPKLEVIETMATLLDVDAYQFFLPLGSPRNVKEFDRESFTEEVTEKLHQRLKSDIRWEVQDVLKKDF